MVRIDPAVPVDRADAGSLSVMTFAFGFNTPGAVLRRSMARQPPPPETRRPKNPPTDAARRTYAGTAPGSIRPSATPHEKRAAAFGTTFCVNESAPERRAAKRF